MIEALFGVQTHPRQNPEVSVVGTSAVRILQTNPRRLSFQVINLSAANVFIAIDNQVASDRGIYLSPNGGGVTLNWDRDFELCSHEWWAIASAGSSDIYVLENVST
jgi:hypothetical protein